MKIFNTGFIILLLFSAGSFAQTDKHIDPSPKKHKHTLSIGKHPGTTFTLATAVSNFAFGTKILQTCNNKVNDKQDVACQVSVVPGSTMGSFGTAGDGLDIINTQAELDQVMGNTSFFVKVVTDMPGNGGGLCGAAGSILACATTPGSSIVIISALSEAQWGEVIIHEFGHTRGLPHRDSPGKPIMHTTTLGNNEVDDVEAAAFHNGGAEDGDNRPVDILFLIDDTGSMGEEISGVRNFLTAVLAGFSAADCGKVFQLVTYKDNVTVRPPTTDLNVIRTQVAALFASGGGDCPEASMQAFDAIYNTIKNSGRIFHATDASPHSGTGVLRSIIVAALQLRGVKIDNIVSGDCVSSSGSVAAGSPLTNNDQGIPFSDNNDPTTTGGGVVSSLAAFEGPFSSIEVFSSMSAETGGVFAFIPQVNTGNALDRLLYENIGFNILMGIFSPTITHIEPPKGPAGGTIALTINGTGTHFNAGTAITFSDPAVVATDITILSPEKLTAIVNINPAAPLGLKDVTANTDVGGSMETAKGKGILNVVSPPSTPTILSISPGQGKQGETLTVKVTGINTHWDNTSVLNLGSGVTILSTTIITPTLMEANIRVSGAALAGYRNVVVTTGTEVANENVIGPFLVITSECVLPDINAGADQTVYYGYEPAACATLSVNGIPEEELADYTFEWSNGETTPTIRVCPTTTTTYTVTVSKGSCSESSTVKVCVVDVRCHTSLTKVLVCHKPNGALTGNVICISPDAVASHLAHGDKLGDCDVTSDCSSTESKDLIVSTPVMESNQALSAKGNSKISNVENGRLAIYPNPTKGVTVLSFYSKSNEQVSIELFDQAGRRVFLRTASARQGSNVISMDIGHLKRGVYFVKLNNGKMGTTKLIVL
ncbi:MAG TPA: T9SS type A sorting domain-containing protein [Chitinophagaceae bacterium]